MRLRDKITPLLLLLCFFVFTFSNTAIAAESDSDTDTGRTIRIGCIDYEGFFDRQPDGSYAGYGVDYLTEISKYTGWKYEYVFDTFSSNMQSVKDGSVDFICHAQKTRQREEDYLFSKYSIGAEASVLYVRSDDDRYYYNDFDNFDGMTIAILEDSFQNPVFAEYADRQGFSFTFKKYGTSEECFASLQNAEVDAVATGSLALRSDFKIVCRFGADPFYFITGKMNQDIMDELDDALAQITGTKPYFQADLYQKYYGSSISSNVLFSRVEDTYIKDSGIVKVGLLPNRKPLSYLDDNNQPAGMMIDIMNLISQKSGLKFEYLFLEPEQTGYDFLTKTDAQLVVGVAESEFSHPNPKLLQSDTIMEGSIAFVGRKGETFDPKANLIVALPEGFLGGETTIKKQYPNFSFYQGTTNDDCLNAIADGRADVMIQNTYVIREVLQSPRHENIEMYPAYSFIENKKVVALPDDSMLISVINKTMNSVTSDEINNIIIQNTVAQRYDPTWGDTLYKYRYYLFGFGLSLAVILLMLAIMYQRKQYNLDVITQKNQQLAEAVAQADSSNMAKSLFLTRMSHEIRTPMNAIVGLTTIARHHEAEPNKIDDYLDKIEVSSTVLLNIINDVLDMSAIESNKIKLSHSPFDLHEILTGISSIYSPQCRQKKIQFVIDTESIVHDKLEGDGLRLNQILLNLVSNAYKFTPEGGKITITVKEKTNWNVQSFFNFYVEDTGEGMEPGMTDRIFQPFEQESAETAAKHGGSGLGLSIAKNLTELMSGSISVTSEKGKGTRFKVSIPFDISQEYTKELPTNHDDSSDENTNESDGTLAYDFGGKKILLAEDTELNAEILIDLLDMVHMQVDRASDGQEAIEKFESSAPGTYEAILMDVQMPVMNGYDATRAIRRSSHPQAKSIRIYALTANAFTEDVSDALNSGMNGHIAKPIDTQLLYATLDKVVNPK